MGALLESGLVGNIGLNQVEYSYEAVENDSEE